MHQPIQLTNTSSSVQTSNSRSPLRRSFLLIAVALACFGLWPAQKAFGVTPAPDGGYPGGNTAEGDFALFSLTTGNYNTADGYQALFSNTTGSSNTATGLFALYSNTIGHHNTAIGLNALYGNTTGIYNTATGLDALYSNTTGDYNMANGYLALFSNTTGTYNTANGVLALVNNTTGFDNTANGSLALAFNTTGFSNVATGSQALYNNTTGFYNMANGFGALYSNDTGNQNTANGIQALFHNTSGFNNTAYGFQALSSNTTGQINTAVGYNALFNNTGSGNIALGQAAGVNLTTGSQNIDIGNQGIQAETGTIRIGDDSAQPPAQNRTFIAGIRNATVTGSAVFIDITTGQLGLTSSSERFKDGIEPMGNASEALLSLRPVTFRYKKNIDPKGAPQFGLVAEEVEKVNPDLVVRDAKGKVFTVRYEAVNAMLLNEFLKDHRTVQEQQKQIKALAAQLKEQAALLQKVSNRLELSKPAPQMVVNNQ